MQVETLFMCRHPVKIARAPKVRRNVAVKSGGILSNCKVSCYGT